MIVEEVLKQEEKLRYMLLDRMQQDCEYYLGCGNRHPKHLWALNEKDHITTMKALYNSFSDDKKPEWITMHDIARYELKMLPKVCSRCGKKYYGYPALSRKDNKTEICPACGVEEALEELDKVLFI